MNISRNFDNDAALLQVLLSGKICFYVCCCDSSRPKGNSSVTFCNFLTVKLNILFTTHLVCVARH